MNTSAESAYRHERLAPGALQIPGTVHMHLNIGMNRHLQRKLRRYFLRSEVLAKESFIVGRGHMASVRIGVREELAETALRSLRAADDLNADYRAELEYVLARQDTSGAVTILEPVDAAYWLDVRTGYTPSMPDNIQVHHMVTIPRKGAKTPITLAKLTASSNGLNVSAWSEFAKPDAWCFRSTRTVPMRAAEAVRSGEIEAMLRHDTAKLTSLFKGVAGVQTSILVEQVMACWEYPYQAARNNRHRISTRQFTGISDLEMTDCYEICEQCGTESPVAVRDETRRSAILKNMEPFRRMVEAQGLTPRVVGLALIPTIVGVDGPRFADHFFTQAGAYASSQTDADALVEAYHNVIFRVSRMGYSPVMSPPEDTEDVFLWSTVVDKLEVSPPPNPSASPPAAVAQAAGQQRFKLTPSKQYKSFEDTIREELRAYMQRSSNPLIREAGLAGIPFVYSRGDAGEYLSGCFFTMVAEDGLDMLRLERLSSAVKIIFGRTRDRLLNLAPVIDSPKATPNTQEQLKGRFRNKQRITQVLTHDKMWTAMDAVAHYPDGQRMKRMAVEQPEAFGYFQDERYKQTVEELEKGNHSTALAEDLWYDMTHTERSNLYKWREKANLPSRRPY